MNKTKTRTCNIFGGKNSEQYNATYKAIEDCCEEFGSKRNWFEETPITSMTVKLVDMLIKNGFEIVRKIK